MENYIRLCYIYIYMLSVLVIDKIKLFFKRVLFYSK